MAASSVNGTLDNDIALPSDFEDTIQSLSWSPVADHLAVASWDGKVRIYDVSSSGNARGVSMLHVGSPVLSCDWSKDGNMVVAGGADKKIHVSNFATNQQGVVGSHDAPVRGVRFVEVPGTNAPIVVSGSWDKTVKFWDLRQSGEAAGAAVTLACDERVYSLDAKAELLVVATAELRVHLADLKNPTAFLRTVASPLRHQTKVVAAFPDGKGWATASIEGRCGINALDEADANDVNFTFKCHRETVEGKPSRARSRVDQESKSLVNVWAVNDIQFHPVHTRTLVTAGSNGAFCFWDVGAHSRLRSYPPASTTSTSTSTTTSSSFFDKIINKEPSNTNTPPPSLTASAFSRDGTFYSYAIGYDWCWGCSSNSPQIETKVMLHRVLDDDAKPKKKSILIR